MCIMSSLLIPISSRLCSVGFVDSGYGYASLTELTKVLRTSMSVVPLLTESPGYGYTSLTGLTEVPGIGAQGYRTHRSAGQG